MFGSTDTRITPCFPMSERGNFRGGRGGGGRGGGAGGGGGDHRGGRGGGARGGANQSQAEKPKKENILDLTKYMDKEITVKFNGGREGMTSLEESWKRKERTEHVLTKNNSGRDVERIRSTDESGSGRCQGNSPR